MVNAILLDMDIGSIVLVKIFSFRTLQGNRYSFICMYMCLCMCVSTQIHRIFKLKALYFKSLFLHLHVFIVLLLNYNFYPIHSCIYHVCASVRCNSIATEPKRRQHCIEFSSIEDTICIKDVCIWNGMLGVDCRYC